MPPVANPNASTTCSRSTIDAYSRTVPFVFLSCFHARIAGVEFASYGRPGGDCTADGLTHRKPGVCHAASSEPVLRSLCVGLRSCKVYAKASLFGEDPCPGKPKRLIAQIKCSSDAGAKPSGNMDAHQSPSVSMSSVRSRVSEVHAGGANGQEGGRIELLSAALKSWDDHQDDGDDHQDDGDVQEAPPPEGETRLDAKGIAAAAAGGTIDDLEEELHEGEKAELASPTQCAAVRKRVGARALGAAGCDSFCDTAFARHHCCFCKCAACGFCSHRTLDGLGGAGAVDGAIGCTASTGELAPQESIAAKVLDTTAGGTTAAVRSEMETVVVVRSGQEAHRGRGRGVGRRGRRSSKRRVMKRLARQFAAGDAPPQPEASSTASTTTGDDHRAATAAESVQAAGVMPAAGVSAAPEAVRQQNNTARTAPAGPTSSSTADTAPNPMPVHAGAVSALFQMLQARRARGEL